MASPSNWFGSPPNPKSAKPVLGVMSIGPDFGSGKLMVGGEEVATVPRIAALEERLSLLLEAIDLSHEKDSEGYCVVNCWSCRLAETMAGIKMARSITGDKA